MIDLGLVSQWVLGIQFFFWAFYIMYKAVTSDFDYYVGMFMFFSGFIFIAMGIMFILDVTGIEKVGSLL